MYVGEPETKADYHQFEADGYQVYLHKMLRVVGDIDIDLGGGYQYKRLKVNGVRVSPDYTDKAAYCSF